MDPIQAHVDLLTGRWFSLIPLVPSHYPLLYDLSFRDQNSFRWRFRGAMPPYSTFEQSINSGVFCQFALVPRDHPERFSGVVIAYNASAADDFCYLAAIADKSAGAGAIEGAALMLRYLFANWPMRKVYIESLEFNVPQYGSAVKKGLLVEEARLTQHHYSDGRYWDLLIYAVTREKMAAFAEAEALFED